MFQVNKKRFNHQIFRQDERRSEALAVYQAIYQGSWLLGPLLPVLVARILGGQAHGTGVQGVCLLSWLACISFSKASNVANYKSSNVRRLRHL